MPNRRASITEADIKRAVRAARKAGATEVVVQMPGKVTITIKLTAPEKYNDFEDGEIIL